MCLPVSACIKMMDFKIFPPIKFWQCQKISDTFLQCDLLRQPSNQEPIGALNLMTQLARQLQTTKMSKQVSWTVQQEEKLIELWREKECLYDVSSQLYHDRVKKEAAWREIGCLNSNNKITSSSRCRTGSP